MSALNDEVKNAWVAHIAAHSGATPHADIKAAVDLMGRTPGDGDFARLENYLNVDSTKFKRDVTYQLYYVTECLIWLWKRLPRQILVRDEGRTESDATIDRLLSNLNAGTLVAEIDPSLVPNLAQSKQGERLPTPDRGVEEIVKRTETTGGAWREVALRGNSHEPPPPPPVWPAE